MRQDILRTGHAAIEGRSIRKDVSRQQEDVGNCASRTKPRRAVPSPPLASVDRPSGAAVKAWRGPRR